MPVRKVVTRRSNHFRGFHPSRKNGLPIAWESQLEASFLRFLELSPEVLTYEVQPSLEVFSMDGRDTKYIPDVCVNFVDGTTGWFEVKPSMRLLNHKVTLKTKAIRAHFKTTERIFHIATEKLILAMPMADNLLTLMYHRRGEDVSEAYSESLSSKFNSEPPQTLADLIEMLGAQEAWRLLGLGYIGIDLRNPISASTPIFLTGGHRHENLFA
ncbi:MULTISPECIES: TnsA endonuclease N-terminal domain-containing protein [unclassified Pseudomonas]|uniref:TnsA endonuclease N-terminal domain-containing protein n=1 Tax=unclassified Pseudomonas TaxID=196821 RepID=UPI001CC15D1A|nr:MULTISPECIES: TnsA endonuclease N-terminal domain-containing protein [unclassified Pseudomonas]